MRGGTMTYYNANVYKGIPDKWAHDECLPDSEFYQITINGFTVDKDGNPYGRQQKSPWVWSPIYGAPHPCYVCGKETK